MHVGMLVFSFSQMVQSTQSQVFCIKHFTDEISRLIDVLDSAFNKILCDGNPEGYRDILAEPLQVNAVEHEKEIKGSIVSVSSYINKQIDLIVSFIKNRPTQQDKVMPFMLQFKNKIDLINLLTTFISQLNTIYTMLAEKGHKKDAILVRKLIIYATEVRSKWVNRSNNDPMKMLENLRNSLK